MSIVYAIHQPSFYDRTTRMMVPVKIDMAEKFGKLYIIFPGNDRPPAPDEESMEVVRDALKNFRPCDRLLLVGDMDWVAFAAVLAAKAANGDLTLLKWHSRDRRYYEVKAPEGFIL